MSKKLQSAIKEEIQDAPPEIRFRGKAIYSEGGIRHYFKSDHVVFKVPSQSSSKKYTVNIDYDSDMDFLDFDCNCPYDDYPCKHMVAAAYYILDHREIQDIIMVDYDGEYDDWDDDDDNEEEEEWQELSAAGKPLPSSFKGNAKGKGDAKDLFSYLKIEPLEGWPLHLDEYMNFNLKTFSFWTIINFMMSADKRKADSRTGKKISIHEWNERTFEMNVSLNKAEDKVFVIVTRTNEIFVSSRSRQLDAKSKVYLTAFEGAALMELWYKKGEKYLTDLINYDDEKQKVLNQYGLKLTDPEAAEFVFTFSHGWTDVVKKPGHILPVSDPEAVNKLVSQLNLLPAAPRINVYDPEPSVEAAAGKPYEVAFLFNAAISAHCGFSFEPFMLTEGSNSKPEVKKIAFKNNLSFYLLRSLPPGFIDELSRITEAELMQQVIAHGFSMRYANSWNNLGDDAVHAVRIIYFQWLQQNWNYLKDYPFLYLMLPGEKFSNKAIYPVKLADDFISLSFDVKKDERFAGLYATVNLPGGESFHLDNCQVFGGFLVYYNHTLYLPKSKKDVDTLKVFQQGSLKIHVSKSEEFIEKIVAPFARKFEVHFPEELIHGEISGETPSCAIYLSELNAKFLLVKPVFNYGLLKLEYEDAETTFVEEDKKFWIVHRDRNTEKVFMNWLRQQHPLFERQLSQPFVYLRFDEAMKDRWFLSFYQHLHEQNIPVYGMNKLKQFRYNVHKPQIQIRTSSGVDWFDLKIEISFGDQFVSLKELKKALAAKQPYVLLGDGTIGMLPEDWLQQYGMLLNYGQETKEKGKEDVLRLSKLHFTLLDHLQIDDEKVLQELEEKKEKLKEVENINEAKIPVMKNVKLRPYQKAGFQWMNVLQQLGWGGCLADDMGLGKTLQVLTFFTYLQKVNPGSTHLIVCPTSLIFNWEAEIRKYAPVLTYHIYYGSGRDFTEEHFNQYDLVLTSYGTLRNDIEHLMKFLFHYIILDESQTIKNPLALTTKATQLLKAKNRLVLSGTPLQNNTGDLYAQFNFLNPGMLGSFDNFKANFGIPIDKYGDKEASRQLKKLIYPLLLRRTKEQVATDLPAKTEIILHMEMDKEQTKIYNAFKDHYRNSLLGRIEKEGMGKSTIYILEGLTKLRQICNSPALLNEEEQYPNISIKLEELLRELKENLGTHKGLVFSQFTSMLQLVKEKLVKEGIPFEYLDGATPAQKRKAAVKNFQENEHAKVFLISLKAGGVGLNLTAADYVYLLDPWWNPAVEQQAIDRTHRIGQTKKVIAYKMICRNTVEEKIIELQERKKILASELISEETGFVKKLSKEDVEWLFT